MNKLCCLIFFFIAFSHYTFSQDSLSTDLSKKKLSISAYFTPSLFFLEPGIQVQYNFSEKHSVDFRYAFLPVAYNINDNYDDNWPSYHIKQLNGYGSVFRIGYKFRRRENINDDKIRFAELRFSYKDLFYPEYCYCDGSSPTAIQSEKKKLAVFNIVFGKQLMETKKFLSEFAVIIGYAYGKSYFTRYSSVDDYCNPVDIVPEEYQQVTENISRPSFGLGWTFYFKAYEKSFLKQ